MLASGVVRDGSLEAFPLRAMGRRVSLREPAGGVRREVAMSSRSVRGPPKPDRRSASPAPLINTSHLPLLLIDGDPAWCSPPAGPSVLRSRSPRRNADGAPTDRARAAGEWDMAQLKEPAGQRALSRWGHDAGPYDVDLVCAPDPGRRAAWCSTSSSSTTTRTRTPASYSPFEDVTEARRRRHPDHGALDGEGRAAARGRAMAAGGDAAPPSPTSLQIVASVLQPQGPRRRQPR